MAGYGITKDLKTKKTLHFLRKDFESDEGRLQPGTPLTATPGVSSNSARTFWDFLYHVEARFAEITCLYPLIDYAYVL